MKLRKPIVLIIVALSACCRRLEEPMLPATENQLGRGSSEVAPRAPSDPPAQSARERLNQIAAEVVAWRGASNLAEAKRHAEATRNLVVGPTGPGYGDIDRDGMVSGANAVGLLPGRKGSAALAVPAANSCAARDLLGGSWEDPAARWAIFQSKIVAWQPGNNTFPTLPSHAQRVVGWATLTLKSADLKTAREFAVHAKIHVDVSQAALTRC